MFIIKILLAILLYNSIASFFTKRSNILYCGIVGFSGPKKTSFDLDKIKLLLMMNQDRGKDSFGYYTKVEDVKKNVGKVEDHLIKEDFNILPSNQLISHTRSLSVGINIAKNAHPFKFDNIVLVMNGTLSNHWELCRQYGFKSVDFDVDSEVLAKILSVDQKYDILEKILGSCATMFINTKNDILYCYRNADRPLFYGYIENGMYISSIENSLKIIGCKNVIKFDEDFLHEIKEGKIIRKYKINRAIAVVQNYNYSYNNNNNDDNDGFVDINLFQKSTDAFIGEWLMSKSSVSFSVSGGVIIKDHYYEVVKNRGNDSFTISIIDENGNQICVNKHHFIHKLKLNCLHDYVFATKDIEYAKSGSNFCKKGKLLLITHVSDLYLVVKEPDTKNTIRIEDSSYIRPASKSEINDYFLRELNEENDKSLEYNVEEAKIISETIENTNKQLDEYENNINAYLNGVPELTEEETYLLEVQNTDLVSFEDLVEFTVTSIDEELNKLQECKQSIEGDKLILRMKALLANYNEKYLYFLEQDSDDEDDTEEDESKSNKLELSGEL